MVTELLYCFCYKNEILDVSVGSKVQATHFPPYEHLLTLGKLCNFIIFDLLFYTVRTIRCSMMAHSIDTTECSSSEAHRLLFFGVTWSLWFTYCSPSIHRFGLLLRHLALQFPFYSCLLCPLHFHLCFSLPRSAR